jgi:CRP/FNR family transcriptional regulator
MNTNELIKQKLNKYFSNELIETLANTSLVFPVVKGQHVVKRGVPFNYIVIVLSGTLKVLRTDSEGNEHVLFYLQEGDACSETFTLCDGKRELDLIAEQEGVVLLVPQKMMDELMEKYPDWRKYVLSQFGMKLREFLNTLDTITFKNLDERLLKYLKDKAEVTGSNLIKVTHQDIANDLATSRVVISRLLKMFERKGILKLSRNKIELKDV